MLAAPSMLCYVTPQEHLGLPNKEDVKQGLMAYKIAAHAADLAKGHEEPVKDYFPTGLIQGRINSILIRSSTCNSMMRLTKTVKTAHFCSMCRPKFCSMKISQDIKKEHGNEIELIELGMHENLKNLMLLETQSIRKQQPMRR